jgi:hypothetical protein
LAPASHPPVDEALVDGEAVVRLEAEPLGHARTKALEADVGPGDQLHRCRHLRRVLQVEGHRSLVAVVEAQAPFEPRRVGRPRRLHRPDGPVDADHVDVGTQVAQQHTGERCGTDGCELDDAEAAEGS